MIDVLEPGALSSIQTADGRPGWRHVGVPQGGAVDPWSARLANRLVGNPDGAALIEVTLRGPELRFTEAGMVAITGSTFETSLDGLPMPPNVGRAVRAGSLLRVGAGDGARAWIAVAGGLEAEEVLGSASTDLRTGFGGHEGRALRRGDRLMVGRAQGRARRWTGSLPTGPVRIVAGPQPGAEALLERDWQAGAEADRAGVRLEGFVTHPGPAEVPSMGLPVGAIQVPPDGRPILTLADRPVTGGYPVPACVIRADIGRVAQLRPGDRVTFASVSPDAARDALRHMENELAALEDADSPRDDELGWAGALE